MYSRFNATSSNSSNNHLQQNTINMSSTNNSTINHHHHHDSSKNKMIEKPHKLHDTPPYSDIFFGGNGFERYSDQPPASTRVTNYYGHMPKYGFIQIKEDIDGEAADFIKSRHKKFELNKTMSMMGG